ncbi:MAG: indolepyruvate ferredoxin oxidoreductase, partial [Alphaproteobacteria bacterium]|nr:indolepyruvate ferredoxin oxidoreductase [Alphaproteobacteria bacterium]
MVRTLREAMTTSDPGLKVIVADGECMLAQQRRKKPADGARLAAGQRLVRERFGIDDTVCTGDHSCVRLSGCPSLTIKPSSDPLRPDPVASIDNGCVGCGLCGEVAHAAILCPSFYRAEIVQNPNLWDQLLAALRGRLIGWLARPDGAAA